MLKESPGPRKLILFGVAVAVPLAAVALYFAIFDEPAPPPPAPRPPASAGGPLGDAGPNQPALPADHPPIGGRASGTQAGGAGGPAAGHPQMGGAGRSVRIPEELKGKWQAVKLRVEEKGSGKAPQVYAVKLGEQLAVPGTKLRVRVGDFLPALQVRGGEITSVSTEPTNPAVMVTIFDGGTEKFRGWLFSKFPDMQPFEHPAYRITLVEGVPAG